MTRPRAERAKPSCSEGSWRERARAGGDVGAGARREAVLTDRLAAWKVAAVLVLSAATVLLYAADIRFGLVAGARPVAADFTRGLGDWDASPSGVSLRPGGILELRAGASDAVTFARRRIADFGRFSFLFVEAEVRAASFGGGPRRTGPARLAVESFDAQGLPLLYRFEELAVLSLDTPWQRVQAVVTVGRETAFMRVAARLSLGTGTFRIRNLTIRGAEETSLFLGLRAALIALWVALALWLIRPFVLRALRGEKLVAMMLLVTCGIYLGALMPKQALLTIVAGIIDPLSGIVALEAPPDARPMAAVPSEPAPRAEAGASIVTLPYWFDIGKLGHIVLFAALAFCAAAAYLGRPRVLAVAGAGALVALTSELLQVFGDARFPSASDLLWNGIGIGAGLAVHHGWRRRGAQGDA